MTFQAIETPATLAAAVRRSGKLQTVQLQFTQLSERHAAIREEIRASIAQNYGRGDGSGGTEIRKLQKEQTKLEDQMRPLAQELHGLRARRAVDVAAALAPTRKRAAERAIAAIADLRACMELIDQCGNEIFRAGGDAGPSAPILTHLVFGAMAECENAAKQIVEAK